MKLLKFSQFINENDDSDLINQMSDYGLVSNTAQDVYDILTDEVDGYFELEENTIIFNTEWIMSPDAVDLEKYTESDFGGGLEVMLDFDKMEMAVWISIQHEQDLDEEYYHTGPISEYLKVLPNYYGKDPIEPKNTKELANQLVQMFLKWDWDDDPFQIWENVRRIINANIKH